MAPTCIVFPGPGLEGGKALATLSPYRTEHINRFGDYVINANRRPAPLEQHVALTFPPASAG